MIRNLILSAALSAATLTGIAAVPAPADAAPPIRHDHNRGRFEVLVRHNGHWDSRGFFRDRDDARRAARQLRQRGFEVKIERC